MIVRQDIFDKVVAQLRRISTSNTYTLYGDTRHYLTGVGSKVYPWRAIPFAPGETGLVVRDIDEIGLLPDKRANAVLRQLHMQIEIVYPGEMDGLRMIFADVEAAIGEGRESVWADTTDDTRPRIVRTVFEQDSAKVAGGVIEFYIDYPTLAFKLVV